jgi:hypothetical protein
VDLKTANLPKRKQSDIVLNERNFVMECLNSIAPTDEELISFALDDEALPAEAYIHLQQCETCQRRLARYKQANTYLLSNLYRSQCPSGQELSLYCADLVSEEDRIRIANHVLDCPLCAKEVAETRKFLRTLDIEEPMASFSLRAILHPIFATRVHQPQPQFAVRGGSDSSETPWPLHYKAETVDLSLHLSFTSKGERMLLGIMTSIDPEESVEIFEGVAAELYTAPGPLTSKGNKPTPLPFLHTELDDLGNFVFKPVPTGQYVLIIYLPNHELVIEDITFE